MTSWCKFHLLIAVAGLFGWCVDMRAGEVELRDLEVGLAGHYQLGHWTPVRFTLHAEGNPWQGDLQISARDGDDAWATYTGGPLDNVQVQADSSTAVTTYVRVGRQQSSLRIVATASDAASKSQTWNFPLPTAVLATQQQVLVIGSDVGLPQAIRLIPRQEGEEIVVSRVEDVAELPASWMGYDGVDVVVLTSSKATTYDNLTTEQAKAFSQWVRLGGRVIVTIGGRGEESLANGSFLARFAPGEFQRTLPLRESAVLETFAEATGRLDETNEGRRRPPPLYTQLRDVRGEVLLSAERDQPIVVRSAYGFGQVIFVGLDLDTEPIAAWPDRDRLIGKLLQISFSETVAADIQSNSGEAVHLGFNDLAGQLRAALEVFNGVSLINFSWVAALIVVYVFLIGPFDYWLVSRVLRRHELTWITSSVIIVAFCVLAWWLASRSRGDSPRVNQIDIVDIDAQSSQIRGTTWLQLYSPTNRTFDVSLQESAAIREFSRTSEMLLGWQGMPGESLGGMNRNSRIDNGGGQYLLHDVAQGYEAAKFTVENLPIPAGGSKGLAARWWTDARVMTEHRLGTSSSEQLTGYFDNPLPVRLTNCLLFHDRWVYRLGNLEPGQRVRLGEVAVPLNSQWLLTDRKIVDAREETRPWDQAMRDDVPKIVRMMLFHELARGRGHTELLNRYYGDLDMSQLLTADRAILLGSATEPATELNSDIELSESEIQHWTFYRIVFPTQMDN